MLRADPTKKTSNDRAIASALVANASIFRRFVSARAPTRHVDDVLQSAAARALERSDSLKDPTRVLPWLYRIHRNILADTLRQHARRARFVDHDARAPEQSTCAVEAPCACSLAQVQRLHAPYADILRLVDAGDASLADAAKALGITTNNATVRLHRARNALRAAMLAHCGVTSMRECLECRCNFDGCCTT